MSQLTQQQINDFYRMVSKDRYQDVIDKIRKQGQLWTLANEQGCVIIETGSEKCLLVWPHPDLAANWGEKDFADSKPLEIKMADYIEKWAPGMTNDGFDIAVAPSIAGEGIVVSAIEFAAELDR